MLSVSSGTTDKIALANKKQNVPPTFLWLLLAQRTDPQKD